MDVTLLELYRDRLLLSANSIELMQTLRDFAVELLSRLSLEILSSRQRDIDLEQLVEQWEDLGLHHKLLELLVPGNNSLEGDDYGDELDSLEGEVIGRILLDLSPIFANQVPA